MHKAKVVHRDIKLQNFMLDQTQNLTIIGTNHVGKIKQLKESIS
jgi:serine/threonine protein kinase